jgi:hypothetical protein
MNAERLHIIALALKNDLEENEIIRKLDALVSSLQTFVGSNNTGTQKSLVDARTAFYEAIAQSVVDSFPPAWKQILEEIGGIELFGSPLSEEIQRLFAENQMTPSVALEEMRALSSRLNEFQRNLVKLIEAAEFFDIGAEELSPGEAEIGISIPRRAVNNDLEGFTDELEEEKFILDTFSELTAGHKESLEIRTLSSSALLVYLGASTSLAVVVAKAVDFVVGKYKTILEIKKLQLEIQRLEMPDEISEKTKDYVNGVMDSAIEKFAVELVKEHYKQKDSGRRNEMTNGVRISLNRIANRIDRGFNFEVRIEPPDEAGASQDSVEKAVKIIQAASANMQYMKLEGPPILALPESIEPSSSSKANPEGKPVRKKKETSSPHSATE